MTENKTDIRWQQRLQNLERAHKAFTDACSQEKYSILERGGLIQSFEFTFELVWKTLQDFLAFQGYEPSLGPRSVIQQAFRVGIISNGEEWMHMLKTRNLTVHTYKEDVAVEIASDIKNIYFELISQAVNRLKLERDKQ